MDWRALQGNSRHFFTQMGKKGIKTYGKRLVVAMLNKYKQLKNLDVFGPQDATVMYRQEKYRSLRAFNLIKENRCGKIKGRTGTDGIHQHTYILQEKTTSPTIALEVLFVSSLIDVHEGIALHTFEVPGEYLHASLRDDNVVHMKFEGEFVGIMCKNNPE